MGLHKILKKLKEKEHEVRVLVLYVREKSPLQPRGLDNAGKSTIIKRFKGEDLDTVSPTYGFEIKTMMYQDKKVNLWDIGGQRSLRSYWRNYFEQTDGIIWVVDSSDPIRLEDCKAELHTLLQEEKLVGATLLVLANKQDMEGALSVQEIEEALDLASIKKRHHKLQVCSAVTGDGLAEGMQWFINDISQRIFLY